LFGVVRKVDALAGMLVVFSAGASEILTEMALNIGKFDQTKEVMTQT
jgi:hypothetical protein